ncbi:Anthranilate 1,2-dioxygenase large subunit [Gemmata obscuriglobus]|uniref:Aromatic ring-hydroxylating dioxygenase subunit alpha n=1 Tax=Gemmata obscuriglobus TaxID=114 RepID=A0A2Z3GZN0_9BACT|nr:aromatic ring-hydroxylating dioxygenase subunit alpha [Gemmata obscuriglobus]AWM39223.1 aromatic ring-hydroxylating dioxygenase subunit alpha [Gemmata obscuriglobus]QEG27724.1 Anthranilate 1,2-dioxygenase large subunit [Gemmata obscuriglobus]VTS04974.1 rieske (2fe-2s) domain-containing protein : Rieske (2Fe-2S) domain-containing protein OS=Rhodopirellula europaea 6C GN=RE6C_01081 PE=4 SV=1: Rieske: Ring_hydroxyl_A [Gemmata obscuriglobus UQM 2246]
MFTNQHHLKHLLRPHHYTSEEQYRAELRHLFQPAWHPVATTSDLARPGDFITLDLLETPFIIRNFDGELRAFLNVCPHRHSKLTEKPRGHAEKLRCQYHGWEFNKDGGTGKIPDAKVFRPWDRENSCLKKFRVDTCGDLVFVNFSASGPGLREWLAPVWDVWRHYGGAYRHAATWEKEFACNWKVVLENSLESYHIPEVHPHTFKEFPAEENVWHELTERFSSFKTLPPSDFAGRAQAWMVRRMGQPVTNEYWHQVLHPHATGSSLDSFRMMQCVFPTGPATCRYRCIFFTLRGTRTNPLAWVLYRTLKSIATAIGKKVFAEDGSIYLGIQRGMEASPFPGVIGTREERVYQFQKYVLDNTKGPRELPQAPAPSEPTPVCAG